jgi:hypothetical protein
VYSNLLGILIDICDSIVVEALCYKLEGHGFET